MKILVIDDERGSHEVALGIYDKDLIISAYNGEEGINAIEEEDPDVILLDITMPIISGEELLKHFKKNKKVLRKIIIITGSADGICLASKYGASGSIWKPFNRKQLKEVIQRVLNGRDKKEKSFEVYNK